MNRCNFLKAICDFTRSGGYLSGEGGSTSCISDTFSDPILNHLDYFDTTYSQIQNLGPGTKTLHRDASDGAIPIENIFFDFQKMENRKC